MSEALLSGLPQAVCDLLTPHLPDLKRCAPHVGKFDLTELKKQGLPSPCVLVSILGAAQDTTHAGHAISFLLQMAAYVVTRDGLGVPRDAAAGNICQRLLQTVPGNHWDDPALGQARGVRMHTLVSGKARDHAVSLWAVTWDQPIGFFQPEERPLGIDLYVARVPAIGLDHEAGYEAIGGQD